jgi:chitodextrinase
VLRHRTIAAFTALAGLAVSLSSLVVAGAPAPATASTTAPALIKDTAYPIPPGATFVSTSGSDANNGLQATPWRTVQHAVNATPSGGTVVIRGGTYRESVALSNKTLTLQAYPHEQVWLKGSVVVGSWVPDGTAWRSDGWTHSFTHLTTASGYVDPAYPMAGYPDMAYIDGVPLTQVASRAQVGPGTFYVDDANHQLYVGSDPTGHVVEAAAYQNVLVAYNAPNSKLLGLGFAHAASQADSASSAVILNTSSGVLVENDTFAWNAASGMEVGQLSPDVVVRGNEMVDNGLVGATSWGAPQRLVFQGNHVAANNQERFSIYWAAGGVKLNGVQTATVADNVVEDNTGTGIWCDGGCSGVSIVRNLVRNDSLMGIMYEISDGAIIASNIVVNNGSSGPSGGGGIYVSESTNAKVYNNTIANTSVTNSRSIDVNSNNRKTTSGVVIENNILSHENSSSLWVVRVQDDQNILSAAALVSGMDSNAYYRRSTGSPPIEVRWGRPGGYDDFATLAAFQASTGLERTALVVDGAAANPFFVNEAGGDFHLQPGSPAAGRGQPLPSDVAAAVGVAPNVAVDMGALVWPASGGTSAPPAGDTTPPSAPSSLSATAAGSTQVSLSWTGSTDNVGVAGYDIYRNGVAVGSTAATTYSDTALAASTTYTYYVKARDAAGMVSAASNSASATTAAPAAADTVAPVITSISPANGTRIGKSAMVSASSTDNVGVVRMELYVDGTLQARSSSSSIGYRWKNPAVGSHTLTVKAFDAAGNVGTSSVTVYR